LVSTAVCLTLTIVLIRSHLKNWNNNEQQTKVVIITLMVPIYAISSLIGIFEIQATEIVTTFLESVREIYEAYVIHNFLQLMFSYLGIENGKIPKKYEGRHIHHSFPFNYFFSDLHLNEKTVKMLTNWTYQFVVLRPAISVLSLFLELFSESWYQRTYFIFSIALNLSVSTAVYALVCIYHAFAEDISQYRPLAQFLCIKGVVFFCFWQGIILEILVYFGIIHEGHLYKTEEIEYEVQNLLVCIEMGLIFSLANFYAFSPANYEKDSEKKRN